LLPDVGGAPDESMCKAHVVARVLSVSRGLRYEVRLIRVPERLVTLAGPAFCKQRHGAGRRRDRSPRPRERHTRWGRSNRRRIPQSGV
jgi:hypothetical protein